LSVPVSAPGTFGQRLLALALEAHDEGLDAEGELRRATAELERALRAAERASSQVTGPSQDSSQDFDPR
jgi:hypothetical protein